MKLMITNYKFILAYMKRVVLLSLLFTISVENVYAADPFEKAKTAIKTGKKLDEAEKELLEYTTAESTAPSARARAFNMAANVAKKIYAIENEKNYLHKSFDTVRYFSSIGRVYDYTLKSDSIDMMPDEKGKVRNAYHKENRKMREHLRQNLLQGGKWMMQKRRYAEAANLMKMYSKADADLWDKDAQRTQIALWLSKCAYANGDMPLTLEYIDCALLSGKDVPVMLEYKSRAQLAVADTTGWMATLCRGAKACPEQTYFFLTLNGYFRMYDRLEQALQLSKDAVELSPDMLVYREALAQNYYDLQLSDECIIACDKVLAIDADKSDVWLYKGVSWLRKAEAFESAANYNIRNDRKTLMTMHNEARVALEKYRELRPNDANNWAPLLYKVYYTLNMGDELQDVEKYIKDANK